MSTHIQILYQIIFFAKDRTRCLAKITSEQLFKYIWGILKKNNGNLYRINGVEDHIQIISHLHPSVVLSNLVKKYLGEFRSTPLGLE